MSAQVVRLRARIPLPITRPLQTGIYFHEPELGPSVGRFRDHLRAVDTIGATRLAAEVRVLKGDDLDQQTQAEYTMFFLATRTQAVSLVAVIESRFGVLCDLDPMPSRTPDHASVGGYFDFNAWRSLRLPSACFRVTMSQDIPPDQLVGPARRSAPITLIEGQIVRVDTLFNSDELQAVVARQPTPLDVRLAHLCAVEEINLYYGLSQRTVPHPDGCEVRTVTLVGHMFKSSSLENRLAKLQRLHNLFSGVSLMFGLHLDTFEDLDGVY